MEVLPTANFQPDVVLWGMRLGEPVIALTGLVVCAVCIYAWFRLGKLAVREDQLRLSRVFFLLTGFSTLIGAIVGHLFLYAFPFEFKLPGWMLGMIAISALEQACIVRAKPFLSASLAKALTWLNIAQLTVALWFVSATIWFPGVEIHSAFGFLLIVLPLEILLLLKTKARGSREILWGIALLVGAVLVHIFKISFGVWFSFFDIAHLFMAASIWKMMLGTEYYVRDSQAFTSAGNEALSQKVAS